MHLLDPQGRRTHPHRLLTPEQLQRYQPWFDNARRLRALLTEFEALSLQTVEEAEGWTDTP